MNRKSTGLVAVLLLATGVTTASEKTKPASAATASPAVMLEVGDAAPAFKSIDDKGQTWDSAEHIGKRFVVIYFYPADFTGGCSKQAESFRDTMNELADLGIAVVGVSGDAVRNHQLFKQAWKLNFTLLADEAGEIAKAFGVPATAGGQLMPYGPDRKPLTNEQGERFRIERKATFARWTFIIGRDGKVLYKNTKVNPASDAKQVLEFIEKHENEAKAALIDRTAQAEAIAAITKFGGRVEVDETLSGHPAIAVRLAGCRTTDADLARLNTIPMLRTLHLSGEISDRGLSQISGLTDVESLSFEGTSIKGTGLVSLMGMNRLRHLNLEATEVDDAGLALVKNFRQLRSLNLAYTMITNKGLVHLKDLTNLESLNLDMLAEELEDRSIAHLSGLVRLKTLVLSSSKLTDDGLKSPQSLPNLESLDVSTTRVTDAGVAAFQKVRPKVKVIR